MKTVIGNVLFSFLFVGIFIFAIVVISPQEGHAATKVQNLKGQQGASMQNQPYIDPTRPGGPGIKPKVKSTQQSFTVDEAKAFAVNYDFMSVDPKSKKEIVSVKFMTSKQASILLSDVSIGVPDNDLVCVIELKGLRVFGSANAPKPAAQYRKSFLVLDAISGNVLIENHADPISN